MKRAPKPPLLESLNLTPTQEKIVVALVDSGIYGGSVHDVVRYMITREIDRLIGTQLFSKHAEMMDILQKGKP